jgi:tetratricopeptide (TPR) repeat protein
VRQACRIGFILAAMLMMNSFAGVPAMAQQNRAPTLDNRVEELYRAGKFSEAVPLAQRALAIREKALGPDHPDVAKSLNSLALLYAKQGRYADAEPLYKRALAISANAIGAPAFVQQRKPIDRHLVWSFWLASLASPLIFLIRPVRKKPVLRRVALVIVIACYLITLVSVRGVLVAI